jgi:putative restriction endonuclease
MFAISTADSDWFDRIRRTPVGPKINFWKPTPRRVVGLRYGDRLYFMLKAPVRKIAGYGKFVRWRQMNAVEAWAKYGAGNGVDSKEELVFKLESYAEKRSRNFIRTGNPVIGCIELIDVTSLPRFVTDKECGLSFDNKIAGLKYFRSQDNIETRADAPLDIKL